MLAHIIGPASMRRRTFTTEQGRLGAPADGEEQSALASKRANPAELRQPALGPPVVGCAREQLLRFFGEYRARVCPQILDTILGKPTLHLSKRVTVLLGVLILIAQPGLPPGRLMLSVS